jgi:hypothetical protein
MLFEDRPVKVGERCSTHPARAAVASCDGCGRALCVSCAVPVRGAAFGAECLARVLGDEEPVPTPASPSRSVLDRGIGLTLAVASIVTLMPWTRFGTGSRWLRGGWALDQRWSMLAAGASVLGLAIWFLAGRRHAGVGRLGALAAGTLVALGSTLAILNPPPFTKPAIAPWISLVAGVACLSLAGTSRPWSRGSRI